MIVSKTPQYFFVVFAIILVCKTACISNEEEEEGTCAGDEFDEIEEIQKCMVAAVKVQKHPDNEKSVTDFLIHCIKFLEKLGFSQPQRNVLNHLMKQNLKKEETPAKMEKISSIKPKETAIPNEANKKTITETKFGENKVNQDNVRTVSSVGNDPNNWKEHENVPLKPMMSEEENVQERVKRTVTFQKSDEAEFKIPHKDEPADNVEKDAFDFLSLEQGEYKDDYDYTNFQKEAPVHYDDHSKDKTQSQFLENRVVEEQDTSEDYDTPPSQQKKSSEFEKLSDQRQKALQREELHLHATQEVPSAQQFQHSMPGEIRPSVQEFPNQQPQIQIGQPQVQHGQPQVQHGQTQVQHGQPQVQHGQPQVQHGQPQVQHGQPQVQHGQPQVQHGQPQVQYGQQHGLPQQQPLRGIPQPQGFPQQNLPRGMPNQNFPQTDFPQPNQQIDDVNFQRARQPPNFEAPREQQDGMQYSEEFITNFKAEMAKRGFPDAPLPPHPAQPKINLAFDKTNHIPQQQEDLLPEKPVPRTHQSIPQQQPNIPKQEMFEQDAFEDPQFQALFSDEEVDEESDEQPTGPKIESQHYHDMEDL